MPHTAGSMFPTGVVTNCFRTQLEAGTPLADLIGEAVQRGFRVFELRQTCLGEFESGSAPLPLAGPLAVLVESFPAVRFNVAVAVPFLQPGYTANDEVFQAGKWAAQAVAGEFPPHLRLVDPHTPVIEESAAALGRQIAELARSLVELDGMLSIEQSRQSWRDFRPVFDSAREALGPDHDRLRLCYDPCNLLNPGDGIDPAETTASLRPEEISLVHAKQRACIPLPTVCAGNVDWTAQAAALQQINYAGPVLYEIEPHMDIWENIESSSHYLRECGFDVAPPSVE